MTAIIKSPNEATKNVTDLVLRDRGLVGMPPIVIGTPSEASFAKGKSLEEIATTSGFGEIVTSDFVPKESKPSIQITVPTKTPVSVGLSFGQRAEKVANAPTRIARNAVLITQQVYEGALVGEEGFGVVADPLDAVCSWLNDDGLSEPLVRVPYTPAPLTGTKSFAVGANMALNFSPDIINHYVSWDIPSLAENLIWLSQKPYANFDLTIVQLTRLHRLIRFHCDSVSVKIDEGDLNFNEQPMQLTFSVNYLGAYCSPPSFSLEWLPFERVC